MSYKVGRYTFDTMAEANTHCEKVFRATGALLGIEATGNRKRFETLQCQIRDLDRQQTDLRIDLRVKYSAVQYAKPAERKRLGAIDARIKRLSDKLFAIIDAEAGRDWHSGAPWHWIVTSLSYDDMITRGQLAIVPPPAFGYNERDMQQFALPVKAEAHQTA
jgi:hypothetical protein